MLQAKPEKRVTYAPNKTGKDRKKNGSNTENGCKVPLSSHISATPFAEIIAVRPTHFPSLTQQIECWHQSSRCICSPDDCVSAHFFASITILRFSE